MKEKLSYTTTFSKTIDGERIKYGIIYGNEKIVFIKVGAEGSIRGYEDKYLKMAHRVNKRIGATVICASNPGELGYKQQVLADKEKISDIVQELNLSDYKVYMFGTSDGAYRNLLLAKEIPETKTMLCVNTSSFDFDDLKEKVTDLPHINKILVYGERDDGYMYVPYLNKLNLDNVRVITIEGADHNFTGRVDEFISLVDLI